MKTALIIILYIYWLLNNLTIEAEKHEKPNEIYIQPGQKIAEKDCKFSKGIFPSDEEMKLLLLHMSIE